MKSEWNTGTIAEICSLVTDGSHFSPKSCETGELMVSVKDFCGFGFDFTNCKRISKEDYEKLKTAGCVPEIGDILIGKDGARFFEDIIIYNQPEKPALLSSIAILRCNPDIILPHYLYYICKNPMFKKDVRDNYGSGSAIPRIVLKDFKRMPISYPSIEEQRRIVAALVAIDDKIALNTAINENLEQQAQALFKAWFVDFEPFGGVMPEDWKCGILSDIAEINSGKRPPMRQAEKTDDAFIPLVGAASIMGYTNESNHRDKILVIGRVGTHGIVQRFSSPCWTSDNTLVITTPFYEYIYQVLKQIDYKAINRGSTQPLITQGDMNKSEIILPQEDYILKYEKLVGTLMNQYEHNRNENEHLTALRDTLLPKLMNGEIDVSEVNI